MIKNCMVLLFVTFSLSQACAAESGNAQKLTPAQLDRLSRQLAPALDDPQLKDIEIHVRPGGTGIKACVKLDGKVCCGSQEACSQQQ